MKPQDENVRQRAREQLDVSIALSAGAGSGKTSVLTERIVKLLIAGHAPGSIAAITFTEKAAGELVARVRDALERRLLDAEKEEIATTVAIVGNCLSRFGELTISTIHSFCRDLLRQEAFLADMAPGGEMGADDELARRMRQSIEAWRRRLRNESAQLSHIVGELASTDQLVEAAMSLEAHRHYTVPATTTPWDVQAARRALEGVRQRVSTAAQLCLAPDRCTRMQNNADLVALLARAAAGDHESLVELLATDATPSKAGGKKPDWKENGREQYAEALGGIIEWRTVWRGVVWADVTRRLLRDVVGAHTEEKRREGLSSFQDLLTLAAAVMRDWPAARERLSERYRFVLVDEVQDTDPIQAEVALLLTRTSDGGGPAPGRLFAVGDPRQSIYRFRGADVATFTRLEEQIAETGERHALVTNFRSVPGIVSWVNHTFERLPGYVPQVAARAASESALDPVVVLQGEEGADELGAAIAWVQGLLKSSAVVHGKRGSRPVQARDVMILLPAWGKADDIADAFRARGIAAVVEGGGAFFGRDEVRLLVEALKAIVEPADGRATVFTLRGLYGLSLAQLAAHVQAGGALRTNVPSSVAGPVADALGQLGTLHRRLASRSLSSLLDELFDQTRAQAAHALLRDGEARSANVEKLQSIVRGLERELTSPFAVVEELVRQARARSGDKDIDRLDDDSDAVRITTLFKAKGLEAPVVVLMHAHRSQDSVTTIVDHAKREIVVRVGKLMPADWQTRQLAEQGELNMERRRWMYVAATRARDQLVLCHVFTKKPGLLAADIGARGLPDLLASQTQWQPTDDDDAAVRVVPMATQMPSEASRATFMSADGGAGLDVVVDAALVEAFAAVEQGKPLGGDPEGDAWARADRERTRMAARGCVRWRSPSREAPVVEPSPSTAPVVAVAESGISVGARVGQVVHEVMERVDLRAPQETQKTQVAQVAPLLARRSGLSDDETSVVTLILTRIVDHPAMTLARSAPEHWREVPFAHPAGKHGVVSGIIDLCFPIDESRCRWVVFDWKSRLPPEGSLLRKRYEEQLATYARALLKSFGDVTIEQTILVGPHKEAGEVRSIDDVIAYTNEALRPGLDVLLQGHVARGGALPDCEIELEDDIPSFAALCFAEERVAVLVDAEEPVVFGVGGGGAAQNLEKLTARGWRICETTAEAAALLGVTLVDETSDDAEAGAVSG